MKHPDYNKPHQKNSTINGRSIAIKVSGTGGHTLFFIHGASMSSSTWLPQLMDPELQKRYTLIAIDLPGHGDSDWGDKPGSYSLQEISGTVKKVIDSLRLSKVLLVGLSYGTNIIGEMESPLPGCAGIMLVSPSIVNKQFPPASVILPVPKGQVALEKDPPESELKEYIHYGTKDSGVAERFHASYRKTDPAFRQELAHVMINAAYTDELANIQKWHLPVCVVFGEQENLIRTNYLDEYQALWNNRVYRVKNAAHMLNEENPEVFNRLLQDFAAAVF